MTDASPQPPMAALQDIIVLDFTQLMQGPTATQTLGDFGARVIKVERPGTGNLGRKLIKNDPQGLDDPIYQALNRNKSSIVLDLKDPRDVEVAGQLAAASDVVVSNFRPGVMERLGLGYEELANRNPLLVYAEASAYGLTGPKAAAPGMDSVAQAESGVMLRKADDSHHTALYGTTLADHAAAMYLTQAILLGLLARNRHGVGQRVHVNLLDSMLAMQMQEAAMWMMRGRELNFAATPLAGAYETADLPLVIVAVFHATPIEAISKVLGLPAVASDPRFADDEGILAHAADLRETFQRRLVQRSRDAWLPELAAAGLICAPVRTMAEALDDPQAEHNGIIWSFAGADGEQVKVVGSPINMDATPARLTQPPPRLGQHTDEILDAFGIRRDYTGGL